MGSFSGQYKKVGFLFGKTFFSDKYIKLFFNNFCLGQYKINLDIFVLGEYKKFFEKLLVL